MKDITRRAAIIIVFIILGILLFINQKNGFLGPALTIFTWFMFVGAALWIRFFTFGKIPDKKKFTAHIIVNLSPYFFLAIIAVEVFYLMKRKGLGANYISAVIIFLLAVSALMLIIAAVTEFRKNKRNKQG